MKINKIAAFIFAGIIFGSAAFAQESETTVEGEYMSDDIIITELANDDNRDNKELALIMLKEAAENGKVSPDMVMSLEHLAGEGINTQTRSGRRIANNYPDIRREACLILGKVGTEEAAHTLNKIVKSDNEPMVLAAAIHSLGEIGYNDNDEVTKTISFYADHIGNMNPAGNSSLALEVVNAYEKLSGNIKDLKPVVGTLQKIATNPYYNTKVRNRAREVLRKLQGSGNSSSNKNDKKK